MINRKGGPPNQGICHKVENGRFECPTTNQTILAVTAKQNPNLLITIVPGTVRILGKDDPNFIVISYFLQIVSCRFKGKVMHPFIDKSTIHEESGLQSGCSVNYRNEILIFGIRSPGGQSWNDYHHVSCNFHIFHFINVI